MKLAWICWINDPDYPEVTIVFEEPEAWQFSKVMPIVYAEIEQ